MDKASKNSIIPSITANYDPQISDFGYEWHRFFTFRESATTLTWLHITLFCGQNDNLMRTKRKFYGLVRKNTLLLT